FSREAVAFLRQLAKARARESPARLRAAVRVPPCTDGWACWTWRHNAHWLTRCSSCPWRERTNATAPSRHWAIYWRT
ncbi:unnamed protein product, partial [Symbiodinium sp. CCMP2456]